MQLATASFALAVILLLGVHHVQAQVIELVPLNQIFQCSSTNFFMPECEVERCDDFAAERNAFTYMWYRNNGMDLIPAPDGDDQFSVQIDLDTCTTGLRLKPAGVDVATDVTCVVTSSTSPQHTVNATIFVFPRDIPSSSTHVAYGFDEQNITVSTNSFIDRSLTTNVIAGAYPLLGETVLLQCTFELSYPNPEQEAIFETEFRPFTCVSIGIGANCNYKETGRISGPSANFTFDVFESNLQHTCQTELQPCGGSFGSEDRIVIHDPARIHPYTSPTGENLDSVTDPDLEKKITDNVTICCYFTGISLTMANWMVFNLNGDPVTLSPDTYMIQPRIAHQAESTDPGLSCINFIMSVDTQGTYQCQVENNVGNPAGQERKIRVTLDGEPPVRKMDETVCLNVDIPTDSVLLDCEPENPDESTDPFMYQWMLGTTDLAFMGSTYFATEVGTYNCTVSNSIGTATTTFTVVANPLAEITIDVIDAMGISRDRLEGTLPGTMTELYQVQFGDTITLTCNNLRGDQSVILFTPNNMEIMSNTYTIPNITVESFVDGTYRCNLNDPTFPQCPPSNDMVFLRFVGDPPVIPPPNGNNVSIVGGDYCLPIGGQIELVCTVQSGTPVVLYEWRVDGGSTVVSTEETYTVTRAGSYECVAINNFGQDMATSRIINPPQAMLTFTVTGATGATLTDSCSRLIEELPTDSQIMHCPYVGDDIVVSCTSDVDSSTIRHEHNGVVATDGTFEYTDAKITDRDVIAGLYTCRAQLEDDCFTEVQGYAQLYDPAVVDIEIPIPDSTATTNNVAVGRQSTPTPIPPGNDVIIYCPYHGLDDPTGRTDFFAIDSEGNRVPSDQLPSPKYSVQQLNSTIVLTINDYSPDQDLYHTFVCDTMNQAGRDSQSITLQEDFVEWCTGEYGQCNMECHLGVRTRDVYCCRRDTRMPVDEARCADLTKPAEEQRCLEFGPCRLDPIWLPQPWSECSASCGGGYRVREVICVIPGLDNMEVDLGMCDQLPLPVIFEYCNLDSCCQADVNHSFCKLIATTPLCSQSAFQAACCWTCQTYFYG